MVILSISVKEPAMWNDACGHIKHYGKRTNDVE